MKAAITGKGEPQDVYIPLPSGCKCSLLHLNFISNGERK